MRGRYPEAAALPGRPELDRLLEEAGAPLTWDPSAAEGAARTDSRQLGSAQTAGTTTVFSRHTTEAHHAVPPATALAPNSPTPPRSVEERLTRSLQQGGLLVLTVHPRIARRAEAELLHRFGQPGTSPRHCSA